MGNKIEKKTEELISILKDSPEYKSYKEQLAKVKQVEGLKEQIDAFRTNNFELQQAADNAFDKIDAFEKEYAKFREDPLVSDFLAAELAFCRLMQGITYRITDAMDFE